MKNKAMDYCIAQYDNYICAGGTVQKIIDRCTGVIFFTLDYQLEYDSPEYKELRKWWNEIMLPAFEALNRA